MSFLRQRMVNKFPLWTKARNDPSSLGSRLFSVWAEYFDWAYADNKRLQDDTKLLKRGLGIGYLYQVELTEEEDFITSTVSSAGEDVFTYPVSVVADTFTVTRVDNIDELCWSPPTRFTEVTQIGVDNTQVYADLRTGSVNIEVIDYPAHLLVQVVNSLDYFHKTPLRNTRVSGKHLIIITGRDVNGTRIVEHLPIVDDGYYWTKNVYTEIEEVVPEGFDGDILVTIGEPADFITDPFRTCVLDDGNEGPLRLEVTAQEAGIGTLALLRYYTDLAKEGVNYRDGVVEIQPNDEDAWEQYLLDQEGDPYEPVDIAIHPNSTRLYVLDTGGFVHVYNHNPTAFGPPQHPEYITKTSYLECIPIKHWARMDEEMTLFTRFARMRVPIQRVTIVRVKPDTTIEFLQGDKTWNASSYEFLGQPGFFNQQPTESWQDFSFTVEFDGRWTNRFGQY